MSVQLLFLCPDEVQIFGLRKLLGARWQIGIFHRNVTDIGASIDWKVIASLLMKSAMLPFLHHEMHAFHVDADTRARLQY
jgi:hypothetical protein